MDTAPLIDETDRVVRRAMPVAAVAGVLGIIGIIWIVTWAVV